MNILAFDTCFGACSAAVGVGLGSPSAKVHALFEPMETGHAERLMPMIRDAMAEAGVGFQDLDRIAATIGPGTFTGTRISVAAARAFALARRLPAVGVSSLAVMAETARGRIAPERWPARVIVAVDARRDQVYAQVFGEGGLDARSPPLLLSYAEAASLSGGDAAVFVGSGAEAVAAAARAGGKPATALLPDLQPHAEALVAIAAHLPVSAEPLRPLYMRPPDAKPQDGKSIARVGQ